MDQPESHQPMPPQLVPHVSAEVELTDHRAWEEIERGRFLPRRIRGSCLGMKLG